MTRVTNAMEQQRTRLLSERELRLALRPILSSFAPALLVALLAGAAANGFARHLGPVAADSATGEWRRLAISPIATGSRANTSTAASDRVTLLAFKPARPGRATRRAASTPVVDSTPLRIDGVVGPDLNVSLAAAGVPAAVAAEYIRALASRIDLARGISVADRFDLVISPRPALGGELSGRLLYAGLDRVGASDLELVRWTVGGKQDWVDADSPPAARVAGMLWPVPEHISSGFGMRMHPLLGYVRFHRGVDLRASWGTPVVAAADGQIASAGWRGGYGREVRIIHVGGIATTYAHMSRITAVTGQRVRQGQVIGYVGSSGLSTGPHLHYEVTHNGRPVDPAGVGMAGPVRTDPHDRQAMRSALRQLLLLKERA